MPDTTAAGEATPLLTTVTVRRPVQRYPHQTLRRFCTIAINASLLALFLTFFLTVVTGPPVRHGHGDWDPAPGYGPHRPGHWHTSSHSNSISYDDLERLLLETPNTDKASEWSRYYTSGPHLAGKNLSQAEWTRDRWSEWGVASEVVSYETYINYPQSHRLALLNRSSSKHDGGHTWRVAFEATLEEDVLKEDPTTSLKDSIPTFHGYSASGNVTGSFVYVNYGTYWDFEDLVRANVSLAGKIAVARYGGIFRGLKVKRAQELGMIGCIIFSDPGDDGEMTEVNGHKAYPDGPARNPSSVQRGSVQFLSVAPGDPTTPGYPSKPGVPRQPVDGAIPSIPSLPLSYAEAIPILKALNGHGPTAKDFGRFWTRNIGLSHKGVEYNIGPSPDDVVINLVNEQDYVITPMWDVIGIINGTIPDEVVVVGNHRDAWIAGGAGDPNSGSSVINEAIRSFGEALSQGWKPLRTIVFASWDGEEYGLVGSTEWVEEYLPWLKEANVAYINVDVGATTPVFSASAAPLLHKLLYDVTARVPSPNQTVEGQTVRDTWSGHISTMGSGSDFTAFQDHAGIPCINFGFEGSTPKSPVYHYHSNYDSYHWMTEYGDPGFVYHKAMAQILGLTIAKMSETPLLALNATDYATALKGYVEEVQTKVASKPESFTTDAEIFEYRSRPTQPEITGDPDMVRVALGRLQKTIVQFRKAAVSLDAESSRLSEEANEHIPWWKIIQKWRLARAIRTVNTKYKNIERAFLYKEGLDERPWFKHVVFAPGIWTGYAGAVFPGLDESIDKKDFVNTMKWADIIEDCIKDATKTIS
ncbi:hypothetical protein Micbo1qcDRAFT_188715 [Microdochium bolleyi]|uniref:Uncharacterized protein n=1 Tax=Microdochium bolleyi TaxID=196109 RepID=A0A136J1Z7_9PEZI|nr:hypothetical protein Micbo1qcDRAFT_188715 [Microdochium bolleyi]